MIELISRRDFIAAITAFTSMSKFLFHLTNKSMNGEQIEITLKKILEQLQLVTTQMCDQSEQRADYTQPVKPEVLNHMVLNLGVLVDSPGSYSDPFYSKSNNGQWQIPKGAWISQVTTWGWQMDTNQNLPLSAAGLAGAKMYLEVTTPAGIESVLQTLGGEITAVPGEWRDNQGFNMLPLVMGTTQQYPEGAIAFPANWDVITLRINPLFADGMNVVGTTTAEVGCSIVITWK